MRKLYIMHLNLLSGDPSSWISHTSYSGSLTVCGSVRERYLNRSTISFRSLASVTYYSHRYLSRLITPVQYYLHTSTLKSSKKQKILSQFLSDISYSIRRYNGLLLLSASYSAGARLFQISSSIVKETLTLT